LEGLDVSVLVNNVGATKISEMAYMSFGDLQELLSVNVHGMALLTTALLPRLNQREG
jgi:short-subunit dehydrogenase